MGLLSELVAIDSVNPVARRGRCGRGEIAGSSPAGRRRTASSRVARRDARPAERPRPGARPRRGRTLLLCGHLDTVGVDGMAAPFAPRREGDRLYGRGAYDMKAGVAAALLACREAAGSGSRGDVVVAAVADEEHASLGVQEVLRAVQADAAIVTEPTELELVDRAQGLRLGRARGDRARRARLATAPRHRRDRRRPGRSSSRWRARPSLGAQRAIRCSDAGSVHASMIEGGGELSSYPARCVARARAANAAGRDGGRRRGGDRRSCSSAAARADPELVAERRTLLAREPFEVDPDAPRSWPRCCDARTAPGARRGSAARATGPIPGSSPPPASPRCSSAPAETARTRTRSG